MSEKRCAACHHFPDQLENQKAPIILATLLHTQGIRNRITALGLTNPVVTLRER